VAEDDVVQPKFVFVYCSDVKSSRPKFCLRPWPWPRKFVLGFGLGLEHLSSACPRTIYFSPVKMYVGLIKTRIK